MVAVEERVVSEETPERSSYDEWVEASLDDPLDFGADFDVVVAADVLEHVAHPEQLVAAIRNWVRPGGLLLASVPNVANIAVRTSLLFGRFRYADRGILDQTHLRFFTRATATELIENAGFRIERVAPTAIPAELASPLLAARPLRRAIRAGARAAARLRPTLFGYQFVFEARPG
jgi:2-polyprenyl-3-methyl-5-hydroxy-6-metoxy-1,4-benzoquinol methylase